MGREFRRDEETADMILVDTSVWIEFFNGHNEDDKVKALKIALEQGEDIYITDIILSEILQGIKEDNKYVMVKNSILTLKFAHAKNYETYIHAADIYRGCRKNGITVRKTIDCIIAAIVIENDLTLLCRDNDFINISKCFDIKLL
jgi:predicted nucleic acid-binding protein